MRNSWKSWLLFLSLSILPSGCQQISEQIAAWRDGRSAKESQVAGDIYEAGRLEREGKLAEARDLYVKAHKKDPENFHAVHRLAVVSTQLKEEAAAKEYFEKALKLNPKDPVLLADMGYALALQEDYPNAERALRLSLKEDAKSERARKSLGRVLAQQGKTEEALDVLRETYPEDQANIRVAGYLIQQKKPAEAEKYLLAAKTATKDDKLRAEIDRQLASQERPADAPPAEQLAAKQSAPTMPDSVAATNPQKIDVPPALQAELKQPQATPTQPTPPEQVVAQTPAQSEFHKDFPFAEPAHLQPPVAPASSVPPAIPPATRENPFAALAAAQTPSVRQPASGNPFAEANQTPASENPFADLGPVAQLTATTESTVPSAQPTLAENPFEQKPVQQVAQTAPAKPATAGTSLMPKHGAAKPRASTPFVYPFAEPEAALLVSAAPAPPQTPAAPAVPETPSAAPPQEENPFAELAKATVAAPARQDQQPQEPAANPTAAPVPAWETSQPSVVRMASNTRPIPAEQKSLFPAAQSEPAFDEKTPVKLAEDTGRPLELQSPQAEPVRHSPLEALPFPVLDFGWQAAEVDGAPQFGEKGWQDYCPVELRENRQLARSSEKFTATHKGQVYRFSSRQCREMFIADPERYIAAGGGMDLVKFKQNGVKVDGSLAFARWYQDRLYFFTSQETLDIFIKDPTQFTHLVD